MKNLTLSLVLAIGFCSTSFSQSNNGTIDGYFTVILGQSTTFKVTENAECDSCYKWEVNNHDKATKKQMIGTLEIVGSNEGKSITINPTTTGIFSVNVVYTDEKGYHTANFMGNVVMADKIMSTETSLSYLDNSKKDKK